MKRYYVACEGANVPFVGCIEHDDLIALCQTDNVNYMECVVEVDTTEVRREMIHALIKASNAFHDSLKESGYSVIYPLGSKTGYLKKDKDGEIGFIGNVTIEWKVNKKFRGDND